MNALQYSAATVEPDGDWLARVKRALPHAEVTMNGQDVVQIEVPGSHEAFGVMVWTKELSGFVALKNNDTYRLKLTQGTAAATIVKAYKAAEAIFAATRAWKQQINAQTEIINSVLEHGRPFGDSFRQALART